MRCFLSFKLINFGIHHDWRFLDLKLIRYCLITDFSDKKSDRAHKITYSSFEFFNLEKLKVRSIGEFFLSGCLTVTNDNGNFMKTFFPHLGQASPARSGLAFVEHSHTWNCCNCHSCCCHCDCEWNLHLFSAFTLTRGIAIKPRGRHLAMIPSSILSSPGILASQKRFSLEQEWEWYAVCLVFTPEEHFFLFSLLLWFPFKPVSFRTGMGAVSYLWLGLGCYFFWVSTGSGGV